MIEIWKPIPDFPGYEVSNLGRIRSYVRRGPKQLRGVNKIADEPQTILKCTPNYHGYPLVTLRLDTGQYKKKLVHNLLALAFIGPRPDGMYVCHKDDDPTNNHLENLKYATPLENAHDAYRNGKTTRKFNGSSQYLGVCWQGNANKWRARIYVPGTGNVKHIGLYNKELKAARAYDAAARKLHGDRAILNFPDEVVKEQSPCRSLT